MKNVISYITLGVNNLPKMQQFYDALGFEQVKHSDAPDHPFVMYRSGGVILALYPKQFLAKQAGINIDDVNVKDKEGAAISLSLNVENRAEVDRYLELAEQSNAKITRKAFEPDWGGYCGYFKDPEANLWEIVWHEKFTFEG